MQRWKLSALAAATLALSGLSATDAWALAMGRITVQSALGEPLRAEVEIPQLSAAEAESLQAGIAAPAAFRAQGMEYSGTANSVRVRVQRRSNGSAVLQLSSAQPVNDPFVDLVIDANWATGKLQRNYTLLLDPPSSRRPAPAPTVAAQVAPVEPQVRVPRPAVVERPASAPATTAGRDLRNDRDQEAPAAKTSRKRQSRNDTAQANSSAGEVRVKTGDTAGRVAAAHKPGGVSLDQMLVAMLRSNPQAFINGNINRIRSGAVIQLPDEASAQSTSPKEARQILAAQSRDFNQFRRQLAGVAPVAPVEAASRTATGQVQAHVDESKASNAAPDKLTLSKGSVKTAAADEKLAQQKQSADQSARADELKRNMAELSQVAAATKPAGSAATPAGAATGAAATPGVAIPSTTASNNAAAVAAPATAATASTPAPAATPTPAAPATPAVEAAAAPPAADPAATTADATQTPAPAPEASAPAPAPVEPPKPAPAPVAPPPEPSFIDSLMENPAIPLAAAAILAVLLGYGGYRVSQRRKAAAAAAGDSTTGDSQLSADSFFGSSGGQRVDTGTSSQLSGQSMQYSPSQLDAGDVDPLAEADVYLAYGRDLQAEEILKEALRTDPNRLVLHQKLAEIYAKRHDRMAYASVANNLYGLTQGKGPEWLRLADQGRILDPENPLYQPGGSPSQSGAHVASAATASTQFSSTLPAGQNTVQGIGHVATPAAAAAGAGLAFGGVLASVNQALHQHSGNDDREGPATQPVDFNKMDLSLPNGLHDSAAAPVAPVSVAPPSEQDFAALAQWDTPAPQAADNSLNLDMNDLASFSLPAAPAATPAVTPAPVPEAHSLNALEFDLDSFNIPLKSEAKPVSIDTSSASHSPSLSLESLDEPGTEPMTLRGPIAAEHETPAAHTEAPAFDMSTLSLDLGHSTPAASAAPHVATADEHLTTKLSLAEEFNAIGDSDGARTLIEEVIAEAHGDLKAKAQALLSQIG